MFGKAFSAVKVAPRVQELTEQDQFVALAWRVTHEEWRGMTDQERTHKRDHLTCAPLFSFAVGK